MKFVAAVLAVGIVIGAPTQNSGLAKGYNNMYKQATVVSLPTEINRQIQSYLTLRDRRNFHLAVPRAPKPEPRTFKEILKYFVHHHSTLTPDQANFLANILVQLRFVDKYNYWKMFKDLERKGMHEKYQTELLEKAIGKGFTSDDLLESAIEFDLPYLGKTILESSIPPSRFHLPAAAKFGLLDHVNRLLEDTRIGPSGYEDWALCFAAENGHLDIVNRLLENNRVAPSFDHIRNAVSNGHLDVVNRLLKDERYDPSADNNYAIRLAVENGYVKVLNRLLQDDRVDPSADNNVAIRKGAINGHLNVENRLIEDERVDPSTLDNEAIRNAAENGHFDIVNRLLKDKRVITLLTAEECRRFKMMLAKRKVPDTDK